MALWTVTAGESLCERGWMALRFGKNDGREDAERDMTSSWERPRLCRSDSATASNGTKTPGHPLNPLTEHAPKVQRFLSVQAPCNFMTES